MPGRHHNFWVLYASECYQRRNPTSIQGTSPQNTARPFQIQQEPASRQSAIFQQHMQQGLHEYLEANHV